MTAPQKSPSAVAAVDAYFDQQALFIRSLPEVPEAALDVIGASRQRWEAERQLDPAEAALVLEYVRLRARERDQRGGLVLLLPRRWRGHWRLAVQVRDLLVSLGHLPVAYQARAAQD